MRPGPPCRAGSESRRDERPLRKGRPARIQGASRPRKRAENRHESADPVDRALAERVEQKAEPDEAEGEPEVSGRVEPLAEDDAVEQIDIGGPAMVRAAAKNFHSVAVVVDPLVEDIVDAELAGAGSGELVSNPVDVLLTGSATRLGEARGVTPGGKLRERRKGGAEGLVDLDRLLTRDGGGGSDGGQQACSSDDRDELAHDGYLLVSCSYRGDSPVAGPFLQGAGSG